MHTISQLKRLLADKKLIDYVLKTWAMFMHVYFNVYVYLIFLKVATFASGSTEWFPYDVGTNLIRNADHTRIHLDVSHQLEKEWTFLVYLTPNWTQNYYGETAFFERNSDDTEIVAEVRPRYGRAVIFQGKLFTLYF